jgi:hypothetical protein
MKAFHIFLLAGPLILASVCQAELSIKSNSMLLSSGRPSAMQLKGGTHLLAKAVASGAKKGNKNSQGSLTTLHDFERIAERIRDEITTLSTQSREKLKLALTVCETMVKENPKQSTFAFCALLIIVKSLVGVLWPASFSPFYYVQHSSQLSCIL